MFCQSEEVRPLFFSLLFFFFNDWGCFGFKLTTEVADLLDKCQVGDPKVTIGEKRGTATGPAHLLREEGPGRGRAYTGGEAERNVSDFPATVHGAESGLRDPTC